MALTDKPFFDQSNLASIEDVMLALEELGHDLPKEQLAMLDHFNRTYLIITRNVRQQMRKGVFEHPEFLRRFDTRFAYYYLDALRAYLEGRPVPPAWRRAFAAARRRNTSPLVSMALGVNAHVNNDIPQVLRDCRATDRHYADYIRVNGIIKDSLHEVITLFKKEGRPLSPHRRFTRPLYALGMDMLVRTWRSTAWRKYKKLRHKAMETVDIERSAARTGRAVRKLPV